MTRARRREGVEGGRAHGEPYDVVVVGGGMAGLTASAFAAKAGCRVLLCDKEPTLGGLVNSFERHGFVWDAGIRAFEDSGIILPMLESLGLSIEFVRSPVSLGIEDRVIPVTSPADLAEYQRLLEQFYPDKQQDIARVIRVVWRVMKHMDVLYGIENPAFKDLRRDREYLFKRLLPWLGKFLVTIGKINRMTAPVDEYLAGLTRSQALIDIVSQHFFRKTPAFFALSYFSLYLDYVYPLGGTGTLPRAVEGYCTAHGVDIRRETQITAVDASGHAICDQRGAQYAYRKLVWAADLKALYRAVDLDALPQGRGRSQAQRRAALVETGCGGDSVFTLYLAVDLAPGWFSEKSSGHFFYTPSRDGVGKDIFTTLDDTLANTRCHDAGALRERIEQWVRRYLGSTTYEISIPALKDSSLAPRGKTGLIISVLFSYQLCEAARQGGWYEDLKTLAEDCMIDVLETALYPRLRGVVLERFSSTPLSIARIVGSSEGAITGWGFLNPVMPAVRRMQQVAHSVETALPDVYQAGQWAYSPSGLPIAILTGKLAADRVVRDLLRTVGGAAKRRARNQT
ncbi:MAG: phytoene desaturase family protein [Candidatus Bipolaricaulia bacterium]